ncbi:Retinol dehydrogenase 14 [Podila verticillata]|nr:Retinol dehydrogenase 14 [Podila verticillata]
MTAESLNTVPVRNYSYDQIPDLTGKCALVTGANQGIGYSTTLGLVSRGAHVTMACLTEAKANDTIEKLHKDVTERYPHSAAAAQIAKGHRLPLDFLLLDLNDLKVTQKSAGIANEPWRLSADGIESHFAVNHLGHFVFTTALLGRLKESQPSRIVVVSRYGRSKLANILFANGLARRLAGSQVRVNSIHPGAVDTPMFRAAMESLDEETTALFAKVPKESLLTPEDGALTQLYVATSPDVVKSDVSGRYFVPIAQEESLGSEALDMDLHEKLWEYSEKVVKEKTRK